MDCPPQLTTEMFRNYGIQLPRCTHLSRMMTGRIQEENLIVLMKQTGPPFKAETPSKACHWEFFWSPLRYGSAKMIYCRESHFTLLMLSGSHYCVPALKATTANYSFLYSPNLLRVHQCGSLKVVNLTSGCSLSLSYRSVVPHFGWPII